METHSRAKVKHFLHVSARVHVRRVLATNVGTARARRRARLEVRARHEVSARSVEIACRMTVRHHA
jgi:hypothetical protein